MKFSEKEKLGGIIFGIIIIALLINLFWNSSANVNFCGDGKCKTEEIGSCSIDCDWCEDGYCQEGEDCSSCSSDCGSCSDSSFCGDDVCNKGECDIGCWKDCSYSQCENGICEMDKGENCVNSPNDCKCINGYCDKNNLQCIYESCGNEICDNEETYLNCPNDCKSKYTEISADPNKDFPIIFVHGHSPSEIKGYSPTELEEFQDKLTDEGYEDEGYILPSDYPPKLTEGIWSGKKISVIMTYYANRYDKLGGVIGPEDNQHISVYVQRLRDVVEVVKHNTGKNKVIIIAHSMGGLVSREYIKNYGGINSVDKLVTIGTPNHGTYGAIDILCAPLHPGPECEDMKSESVFLIQLNSDDETPGDISYLTIIGKNNKDLIMTHVNLGKNSCPNNEYWDNVICSSSVYLQGAENYYYEDFSNNYETQDFSGEKESLHTTMVKPSKALEVYNKIISFIKQ